MNSIAQSFANLVKTNNGFFKSDMQQEFLLNQLENGTSYISCGNIYGNSFNMEYFCDELGVTKVTKYSKGKGDSVEWVRRLAGSISVQDEKKIKFLERMLKSHNRYIASRQAAFDAGEYDTALATKEAGIMLFETSQKRELLQVTQIARQIKDLKNGINNAQSYYDTIEAE